MYEDITEQIKIGIEGKQQILTFNAKIAATIEGNKTKVTKGWAQLLKLGNKGNMITLNIVKAKCKGVWKWVQVAERSIYAYVLTDITSANTVKDIKVDVQKQHGLQKLEKISAYIIYIYTRYRTIIEKGNVYKLLKTREPQGSYNK